MARGSPPARRARQLRSGMGGPAKPRPPVLGAGLAAIALLLLLPAGCCSTGSPPSVDLDAHWSSFPYFDEVDNTTDSRWTLDLEVAASAADNSSHPAARRQLKAACDYTQGRWLYSKAPKRYTGYDCPFIRSSFNCDRNGRKDGNYQHYSWRPYRCRVAQFDPAYFLSLLRGKIVGIVGDSFSRDFAQSLICQIARHAKTELWAGNVAGVPVTGVMVPSYHLRVITFVAPYLVKYSNAAADFHRYGLPAPGPNNYLVWLDQPDPQWAGPLRRIDLTIFMSGHWFLSNQGSTEVRSTTFVQGNRVVKLAPLNAYQAALNYVKNYVSVRHPKYLGVPMWLTYSPSHYTYHIGNKPACTATQPTGTSQVAAFEKVDISTTFRRMEYNTFVNSPFRILDITHLSNFRIDAHVGKYYGAAQNSKTTNDCTHWCLPGLPDVWTDILQYKLQTDLHRRQQLAARCPRLAGEISVLAGNASADERLAPEEHQQRSGGRARPGGLAARGRSRDGQAQESALGQGGEPGGGGGAPGEAQAESGAHAQADAQADADAEAEAQAETQAEAEEAQAQRGRAQRGVRVRVRLRENRDSTGWSLCHHLSFAAARPSRRAAAPGMAASPPPPAPATCARLRLAPAGAVYVRGAWLPDAFHLAVTNGAAAWTYHASSAEVAERADDWDIPPEEYVRDVVKKYLAQQQPSSTYSLDVSEDGKALLTWTLLLTEGGIKYEARWELEAASNSQEIICSILDFVMDDRLTLLETIDEKARSFERMKAEAEKCLTQSERFKDAKQQAEDVLLKKVVVLLNAKKAKIRELQAVAARAPASGAKAEPDEDSDAKSEKSEDMEDDTDEKDSGHKQTGAAKVGPSGVETQASRRPGRMAEVESTAGRETISAMDEADDEGAVSKAATVDEEQSDKEKG
eukprot:SM000075S21920  [mRNA]  locus=s75:62995:69703:- [translate_table: standard]